MPPNQGERINALEAKTEAIQAELAAYRAAADERRERLQKSNKAEHAATRDKLDATQASLTAIIALLTTQRQGISMPPASLMPTMTPSTAPADPTQVVLPPSPPLAGGLQESLG